MEPSTNPRLTRIHIPPWNRLGERTQKMLQCLNASTLLREADLIALVWPDPVSRQAQEEALTRWQHYGYMQPVRSGVERCYQLDRVGAKILRNYGVTTVAPIRPLKLRVHAGVLLTNQLVTSLIVDAQHDPRVTGVAWLTQPFRGRTARPDGEATIQYRLVPTPEVPGHRAIWYAEMATESDVLLLREGEALLHLAIEIDRGTESSQQLRQRAKHWRTRWEAMPHTWAMQTIILWLTTGTQERLNTIWEAWIEYAFLPAFFAVQRDMAVADGPHARWSPWEPRRTEQGQGQARTRWRWRDLYGRPRSLKPWELHEPVWRREAMQPVTLPSLTASIAAWDRMYPVLKG